MLNRLFPCILLLLMLGGCVPVTPVPTSAEQATSPQTTAAKDAFYYNARLGRGINLGNMLEAPYEGAWGLRVQEQFFPIIAEAGFDSVRIPIRWSAYADQEAPYTIKEKMIERVDWVVEQALGNDLVAVINIHHYAAIMTVPDGQRDRFLGLWQQLAEHYQDYPDTVYFEILNEPHENLLAHNWQPLWQDALAVIRASNPARAVIVGPNQWHSITKISTMNLPADDDNIIVTFHYYEPFAFTHQGASWVNDADKWLGTEWTGSSSEARAITNAFDKAAAWAEKHNVPLYMGEFGAYSRADIESRARWTAFVTRAAEKRGFSWAYWEFGSGFGAYDMARKSWNEPLLHALVPLAD